MNYTVGDFIIQIKNAALARKKELYVPFANINKSVAKVLAKSGFLESVSEEVVEGRKFLHIALRYVNRKPVLTDVVLVSKPSLRVYVGSSDIKARQGSKATAILSTNAGILTGKEAIKKGVGGELLFMVW